MPRDVMREFFLGFVKIHVLHHAADTGFYGVEIMRELGRHGYGLGPGTLYPMLHALEQSGHLSKTVKVEGGRRRIYYRATPKGVHLLRSAKKKVRELVAEVAD